MQKNNFFTKISKSLSITARILIKAYQLTLSPDHGIWKRPYGHCRYYPTCSQYADEAIEKYGIWKGGVLGAKRIGRCHPFNPPKYDPVPDIK